VSLDAAAGDVLIGAFDDGMTTTMDGGPTSQPDADAKATEDPRFHIVEPLAPPADIVAGTIGNRRHHAILPTDQKVTHTALTWASADGAILIGQSIIDISRPSTGDYYGSYPASIRWTAEQGTVPIGDAPNTFGNIPRAVSVGATTVFGVTTNEDGSVGLYRWSVEKGTAVVPSPAACADIMPLKFSGHAPLGIGNGLVSADGKFMVAVCMGGDTNFRYTEGVGWQLLPDGQPWAMSQSGDVLVSGQSESFRWSDAQGAVGLGTLPEYTSCIAKLMTSDGSVIVGGCSNQQTLATTWFRWTEATGMVSLPDTAGTDPNAMYMTPDAQVVMGAKAILGEAGRVDTVYRYSMSAGVSTTFQISGVASLQLNWIGNEGQSVFGFVTIPRRPGEIEHSFRWLALSGGALVAGPPGLGTALITSSNPDGSIMGGAAEPDEEVSAFQAVVWDAMGPRLVADELTAEGVDLRGLRLEKVLWVGSGPDVRLIGSGYFPDSKSSDVETRIWVSTLPLRP